MNRFICILAALLVLGASAAPAAAQLSKDQLREQFKARDPELRELKRQGRIGETIDGNVDVVDPKAAADERVARLVSDENNDRRRLYQILADEINTENPQAKVKATIQTIAVRNARRNIERASPEELIRVAKDHWIRAREFPRFEALTKLKTQGKVGETGEGLVAIVQATNRADAAIGKLVDEENASRRAEYKAMAEKEGVEILVIAKRMAKRNFENARIGDMLSDEGAAWRKK